jgi:NADH dehydrogenase/NADH:ubiquinone oxidoreductase subunit G
VKSDLLLEAAFRLANAENPVIVYEAAKVADLATLQSLVKLAETLGATLLDPKGGANSLAAAQYSLDKTFKLNGHKAAFVALGDEIPSETLVKNLEKAPFLVVQASHVSKLTAKADVILPVQSWLEQEGHYVSMDGAVLPAAAALKADDQVLANDAALARLADRLGFKLDGNWKDELIKRQSPVEIAA